MLVRFHISASMIVFLKETSAYEIYLNLLKCADKNSEKTKVYLLKKKKVLSFQPLKNISSAISVILFLRLTKALKFMLENPTNIFYNKPLRRSAAT